MTCTFVYRLYKELFCLLILVHMLLLFDKPIEFKMMVDTRGRCTCFVICVQSVKLEGFSMESTGRVPCLMSYLSVPVGVLSKPSSGFRHATPMSLFSSV